MEEEKELEERDEALEEAAIARIARGIADVEEGRVVPVDQAFEEIRRELGLPPLNPE